MTAVMAFINQRGKCFNDPDNKEPRGGRLKSALRVGRVSTRRATYQTFSVPLNKLSRDSWKHILGVELFRERR